MHAVIRARLKNDPALEGLLELTPAPLDERLRLSDLVRRQARTPPQVTNNAIRDRAKRRG